MLCKKLKVEINSMYISLICIVQSFIVCKIVMVFWPLGRTTCKFYRCRNLARTLLLLEIRIILRLFGRVIFIMNIWFYILDGKTIFGLSLFSDIVISICTIYQKVCVHFFIQIQKKLCQIPIWWKYVVFTVNFMMWIEFVCTCHFVVMTCWGTCDTCLHSYPFPIKLHKGLRKAIADLYVFVYTTLVGSRFQSCIHRYQILAITWPLVTADLNLGLGIKGEDPNITSLKLVSIMQLYLCIYTSPEFAAWPSGLLALYLRSWSEIQPILIRYYELTPIQFQDQGSRS